MLENEIFIHSVESSGLSFHDIGDAETGVAMTTSIKDGRYEYGGERVSLHRPDMGMLTIAANANNFFQRNT